MKKQLRFITFLALAVILMMTVCSASEIVPGKNLLTGTTEPLTFDGLTELPSGIEKAELSESPFSHEEGKVLLATEKNRYASVDFAFDPALPSDRHYQVSFKIYQKADEGYGKDKSLWIMKNARAGWQVAHSIGGFVPNNASGWMEHSAKVETFGKLVVKDTGAIDTSDVSKILIEWGYDSVEAATVNQKIYIDDVSIVPLYKITCLDENGNIYKEYYENITGSTFKPSVTADDSENFIIGWSLEKGGEAVKEIPVNYKDITLYAVYDNSLRISLSSDINLLDKAGASVTVKAAVNGKNAEGTTATFAYSVAEGNNFVTLTDNKDGTATVVSKAEGMSKIVYTASTGEKGEIYILSDYSGVPRTVRIIKEASDINVDSGTSEMQAVIFASVAGERKLSWKTSDANIAIIKGMENGKATLVAIGNGKVTVTAFDETNEEISAGFEVTVSNQRQKFAVYDLRIQFWGASTTQHGASPSLAWYGNWGMAASSEDKDYVHRLVARLEEEFYPSKVNYHIVATSAFDTTIAEDTDPKKDYSGNQSFVQIKQAIEALQPNIIVVAQTGNSRNWTKEDCMLNAYTQVYDMMYDIVPDAIILAEYCSLQHRDFIERVQDNLGKRYAGKNKVFINDHSQLVGHPEYFASEYLLLDPPQTGVAAHWNDKGMDETSRVMFNYLVPYIRSMIEPTYIYIPDDITISGANKITTEAGTAKLSASANPADASNDVFWSVDNEKLAVINEYGMLTAINNGTVTVTAKSKYNDKAIATYKVVITGQPEAYTVTYKENTTDAVSGMPEEDNYAKGEYTLSEKRPLRDCYTFVGWGLTPDAADPVTAVSVTENTTVYAIWEKTEGFEFDGNYDEFFGYVYGFDVKGGFHAEIIDGKLTAVCTMGEKVTFKSPKVDIKNSGAAVFALESGYHESGTTVELTVNTTNDSKKYVFPLASDNETVYVADTTALSGNITGFEIFINAAPEGGSMFPIDIDYVRFDTDTSLDAAENEFSVSDGNTTISSITHKNSSSVAAGNSENSYVEASFDSGFGVEIENLAENASLYLGTDKTGANVFVTTKNYESGKYDAAKTKMYTESDGFFMENEALSQVLTSYDRASIRTAEPQGMRVMASVVKDLYERENVAEYGFVVAKLEKADNLVLGADGVACGAAFSKADGVHKVYDITDTDEIFTAALVNIPENKASLETKLVFRPYVKLSDGKVMYGAKTQRSVLDVAKSIAYDSNADEEAKAVANRVLEICGYEFESDDEVFLPADSLFPEN